MFTPKTRTLTEGLAVNEDFRETLRANENWHRTWLCRVEYLRDAAAIVEGRGDHERASILDATAREIAGQLWTWLRRN